MPDAEQRGGGQAVVDIGNSRIKLGWFADPSPCTTKPAPSALPVAPPRLPSPELTAAIDHHLGASGAWLQQVEAWLEFLPTSPPRVAVLAGRSDVADRLLAGPLAPCADAVQRLSWADFRLKVGVDRPHHVGVDRLANALAARHLCRTGQGAIVVDAGTALTVDLVDEAGTFAGGAILAGPRLAARALQHGTATLPEAPLPTPPAPAAVGKSTVGAIQAGLVWGAVGAVRELVGRMTAELSVPPAVVVTGGDAPWLAPALSDEHLAIEVHEHLTLVGAWIAAQQGN